MDDVIDELVPVDPEDFLPCPGERRDKYAHGREQVDVACEGEAAEAEVVTNDAAGVATNEAAEDGRGVEG